MTDIKDRLKNLSPEQQALLKLRLQKKGIDLAGKGGGTTTKPVAERARARTTPAKMNFGIYYFSDDGKGEGDDKYRLLLDTAKLADELGFHSVWTPERHFQAFGGLFPNPSVLSAALAMITETVQIRAGSVVLPLHSPVRVAEEWGLVDNLSKGRVGLSFATGWHDHDYVIRPENFHNRRELMFTHIDTVRRLWRGETVSLPGVDGKATDVLTLPRPIQADLPIWITASSNRTWRRAGEMGANVLSMLGASLDETAENISIYREARAENGHDPRTGIVSIMLHTYVDTDLDRCKEKVRAPLSDYLRNFLHQFEAIAEAEKFGDQDSLLDFAFERYFANSSLLGTPDKCAQMVETLADIGVNDAACLVDFGLDRESILTSMRLLDEVRAAYQPEA